MKDGSADEAALVRAILTDPHDDLARSAYADWLEEQALPLHAELMRLPLPAHGRMPVEALGDRIEGALSHNGGVYPNRSADGLLHVQVQMRVFRLKAFQKNAPAVLRGEHVVRLLIGGQTSDWRAVAESPALAAVPGFALRSRGLGEGAAEALARSPAMPSLWSLSVGGHASAEDVAVLCAAPLADLVHLDLSHSRVPPDAIRAVAAGPAAGRLRHLDLFCAALGITGVAALAASPVLLRGLVTLKVSNCGLGDDGLAPLLASPDLHALRSLNIAYNGLTDVSLLALASSPHVGRLTSLTLGRVGACTRAGLGTLADALPASCRVVFWRYEEAESRSMLAAVFGGRLSLE